MGANLELEALAQELEGLARREGIRRWDLGAGCSTDTSVQVDRGEAKQMKGAQRSAITVRVWNDAGLVGITSTSDLSPAGLARALAGAHEASAFGNPDDIPAFSPLAQAPLPSLEQPIREPAGILTLLDTLKQAERELLGRHPAIGTVPYNGLAERRSERLYLNSDGACRRQQLTTASLYLYARAEEAGRKPRSSGAVRLAYGAADLDVAGCIAEAAERSHLRRSEEARRGRAGNIRRSGVDLRNRLCNQSGCAEQQRGGLNKAASSHDRRNYIRKRVPQFPPVGFSCFNGPHDFRERGPLPTASRPA